jgi:hypothetical protein
MAQTGPTRIASLQSIYVESSSSKNVRIDIQEEPSIEDIRISIPESKTLLERLEEQYYKELSNIKFYIEKIRQLKKEECDQKLPNLEDITDENLKKDLLEMHNTCKKLREEDIKYIESLLQETNKMAELHADCIKGLK